MEVDGRAQQGNAGLGWEDKVYTLTATGEGDVQTKAALLQQIAAAVKD